MNQNTTFIKQKLQELKEKIYRMALIIGVMPLSVQDSSYGQKTVKDIENLKYIIGRIDITHSYDEVYTFKSTLNIFFKLNTFLVLKNSKNPIN